MKLSRKVFGGLFLITAALLILVLLQPCIRLSNEWNNVVTGMFTSSAVVLIIEFINLLHDCITLSKLEGIYTREKITNWRPDLLKHEDITHQHPNKEVSLKYKGEGEYQGTAIYGQDKVNIIINLDKVNPKIGKGIYQYIYKLDLGNYEIQVDQSGSNKIYVSYSNVISSNPELSGLVSGYEIWQKK